MSAERMRWAWSHFVQLKTRIQDFQSPETGQTCPRLGLSLWVVTPLTRPTPSLLLWPLSSVPINFSPIPMSPWRCSHTGLRKGFQTKHSVGQRGGSDEHMSKESTILRLWAKFFMPERNPEYYSGGNRINSSQRIP